jgi:hypothetical protein
MLALLFINFSLLGVNNLEAVWFILIRKASKSDESFSRKFAQAKCNLYQAIIIFNLIVIMTTTIAQAVGKYADVNGIRMYYKIHGTGSPLVLLHGGGSTIYTSFGRILPALAKSHQVMVDEFLAAPINENK